MRHLIVGAGMLFAALGVTFGTASFLQVIGTAHHNRAAETVVVEATKPALAKQVGAKERTVSVATRSASSL